MGPYNWWIHKIVKRVSLTMYKIMTHIIFCNFLHLLYMILVISQCDAQKNFFKIYTFKCHMKLYSILQIQILYLFELLSGIFLFFFNFVYFIRKVNWIRCQLWLMKKKKLDRGFRFQICMHNCLDCICLIHPKGK